MAEVIMLLDHFFYTWNLVNIDEVTYIKERKFLFHNTDCYHVLQLFMCIAICCVVALVMKLMFLWFLLICIAFLPIRLNYSYIWQESQILQWQWKPWRKWWKIQQCRKWFIRMLAFIFQSSFLFIIIMLIFVLGFIHRSNDLCWNVFFYLLFYVMLFYFIIFCSYLPDEMRNPETFKCEFEFFRCFFDSV